MYRKIIIFILAILVVSATVSTTRADSQGVKIYLNGSKFPLIFNNVQPVIENGTLLIPLRDLAQALGASVEWNEQEMAVYMENPHAIVSIPEKNLKLYSFENTGELYKGFVLDFNGKRQYLAWNSLIKPGWEPQVYCLDLNNDLKDEIVIALCQGEGTGFCQWDIHILDADSFGEIPVENPLVVIKGQVQTNISKTSTGLAMDIQIGEKTYTAKSDYLPTHYFKTIGFGNIVKYELVGTKIYCDVPAQFSDSDFIGEIRIIYTFDDNSHSFKASDLEYLDDTNI